MHLETVIRKESWDVDARLSDLDLSKAVLIEVVQKAVCARNDSVIFDPINAPGMLAYIYGVRALRELLVPKGWRIGREENIEATYNSNANIRILYQNVDNASGSIDPKAVSNKGAATQRMINEFQPSLFPEIDQERRKRLAKSQPVTWFLCVSAIDDDVMAELSCPRAIDGGQFSGFVERIFLVKSGDWKNISNDNSFNTDEDVNEQDFQINVSRK